MKYFGEREDKKKQCCCSLSRLLSRSPRAMEGWLEGREAYIVAAIVFPPICLLILFVTAGLDLSSASPTGEWSSIFSGVIPSRD